MDGTSIESQKLDNLRMKDEQFKVQPPQMPPHVVVVVFFFLGWCKLVRCEGSRFRDGLKFVLTVLTRDPVNQAWFRLGSLHLLRVLFAS